MDVAYRLTSMFMLSSLLAGLAGGTHAIAQHPPDRSLPITTSPSGVCKPVSQRTTEVGCWIVAHEAVGQLPRSEVYWYLDVYPSREAAEAAKGPRGTVVASLGKVWLLSIEDANWRSPPGGERVAEIGPLQVTAGANYSAQYLEAIFAPGMTAPAHTHAGPEAWYTLAGETCLETPQGTQIGRAGGRIRDCAWRNAHAPYSDRQRAATVTRANPS